MHNLTFFSYLLENYAIFDNCYKLFVLQIYVWLKNLILFGFMFNFILFLFQTKRIKYFRQFWLYTLAKTLWNSFHPISMLFRVITQLSRPFRLSNLESEAGVKVKNEYFILKLKKTKDLKTEINSYGKTKVRQMHIVTMIECF